MKKLFENWNKFCKEGLNEVSPKQRVHDERVATQREERNVKDAEAQELQQILGDQWVVNLRRLEGRYQLTVYKQLWGGEDGRDIDAEGADLHGILGPDWEINVTMLEGRYQLTVHKSGPGEQSV